MEWQNIPDPVMLVVQSEDGAIGAASSFAICLLSH